MKKQQREKMMNPVRKYGERYEREKEILLTIKSQEFEGFEGSEIK